MKRLRAHTRTNSENGKRNIQPENIQSNQEKKYTHSERAREKEKTLVFQLFFLRRLTHRSNINP